VARTIHRNSLRSRERFVQVNCAADPEELIESELFGHEKGIVHRRTEKQVGKFEQADRGTIFLDEVGDMSAKTQAKVLRVLQEGRGRAARVGAHRSRCDVRVIAATNKNLEEENREGHLPRGPVFPARVIPVQVPPLRERAEDIPPLVRHYMEYFARENNVQAQANHRRGTRHPAAAPVEGQHPRAAEYRRAADDHDAPARPSTSPICRTWCDLRRRSAAADPAWTPKRRAAGRCASSRTTPSAPTWSPSCARTGGTSRRPRESIDTPRSNLYTEARAVSVSRSGRTA
jgi:MoxR-like ATPase